MLIEMRGTEYADIVCRSWHCAFLKINYYLLKGEGSNRNWLYITEVTG